MPETRQPAPLTGYQLRVVVRGVSPLICRRLLLLTVPNEPAATPGITIDAAGERDRGKAARIPPWEVTTDSSPCGGWQARWTR